ncbi:hypothetical protein GYA19_06330 [Candidatus Beckwithbacteria bacterium]|nr:hypothetical protein [Candidatus Beckwithbacteria bacterium]
MGETLEPRTEAKKKDKQYFIEGLRTRINAFLQAILVQRERKKIIGEHLITRLTRIERILFVALGEHEDIIKPKIAKPEAHLVEESEKTPTEIAIKVIQALINKYQKELTLVQSNDPTYNKLQEEIEFWNDLVNFLNSQNDQL